MLEIKGCSDKNKGETDKWRKNKDKEREKGKERESKFVNLCNSHGMEGLINWQKD